MNMNVIDLEQYRQQQRRILNQDRVSELEEKLEDRLMQVLSEDKYGSDWSSLDYLGWELLYHDHKNVLGLIGRAYAICKYNLERSSRYMEDAIASDTHKEIATRSFLHLADQYKYNWNLASSKRVIPAIGFSLEHFSDDERMMEITLRLALHFRNFNIDGMIRGAYNNLRVLNTETAEKYRPVAGLSVRQPPKLKLVGGEKWK